MSSIARTAKAYRDSIFCHFCASVCRKRTNKNNMFNLSCSPEVADPVRETVVGQPRALRFVHMGRCRDALCQTCRQMGHSFRKLHRHRLQTNQRFVPSLVTVWSSCENIDRNWTSSRPSGLSLWILNEIMQNCENMRISLQPGKYVIHKVHAENTAILIP